MKNIAEDFSPKMGRTVVPPQTGFTSDIQMDYSALLDRTRRNWYWFVLAVLLCLSLAWLHLRYTTPIYLAQTSMLIEEDNGGGQGGLSKQVITDQLGFSNTYVIDNEIYMLKSKYLMERVVDLLGLDISYVHRGSVRDIEIYQPESFALSPVDSLDMITTPATEYGSVEVRFDNANTFSLIRYEGDTTSVRYGKSFPIGSRNFKLTFLGETPSQSPEDIYQINVMNPTSLAQGYSGGLSVYQVERSGVVNLSFMDAIPEKARDILNALILVYEKQIVEQQSLTGGQTVKFIEERLDFVTEELYEVESNVASFKRSENMSVDLATQGANYLAQLNEADAQLSELQVRQELIEEIRRVLTEGDDNFEPLPLASEVISGMLADLIAEYNQTIFTRDQQLEAVTPSHPSMATFSEKLANLKRTILRSINSVLRETKERANKIEERIKPLEAQITRIPGNEQKLLQIMRQQEIKQNLFMFLLEKREEAALTVAAQIPNTRIIDRASSLPFPISPNKNMFYAFAFGLGLFIPGSFILLSTLLSKHLSTEKEITKSLPYPVIGRIIKTPVHHTVVVNKNTRSAVSEGFRLLRTNLGFMLPTQGSSVIMITSSVSGEGKSFIASNLAASLALTKKRVVVVGMDMRKPKLAEMVLNEKEKGTSVSGLSNYLIAKSSYEEVIKPTENERMFIIPSGPIPPNPAELLMENRMATLLDRLRQDFDIIILDAPPVGIVTDGLLMKDHIDICMFVTRIMVTPKKSTAYINELVEAGNMPRFSLVINGLDPKSTYGYGYGYYK